MGYRNYKWKFHSLFCIALLISAFLISSEANAQARDTTATEQAPKQKAPKKKGKGFQPQNLVVGGGLGASFGNNITYIEVSPRIGYFMKANWLVGIGGKYSYYEEDIPLFGKFTSNMYGGGVYTQYYFLRYLVAHAEYEILNLDSREPPFERTNIHSIFVGGGLSQRAGRGFFNVLILYNLNETFNSPYANPYLTIGFREGF